MKFDEAFLNKIKEANPILDVAKEYFDNIKKVNEYTYQTYCKHGEDVPSLTFFTQTQTFYCFGCKAGSKEVSNGSDVIAFVQWMEEVPMYVAVLKLAKRANIPLPGEDPEIKKQKEGLLNQNRKYWKNLQNNYSMKQYVYSRGLDDNDIVRWRLGCTESKSPKLVFAIMDECGDTIGFAMRSFADNEPKYTNSSTSSLFNKRQVLYGLNYAAPLIRKHGFCVLVEGYFDTILLQKYNVPAVACMGTGLTKEQIELLFHYTNSVILFFDGDEAGETFSIKAANNLLENSFNVKIVVVPEKDPDEIALQFKDSLIDYIKTNALTVHQYRLNKAITAYNKQIQEATEAFIKEITSVITSIKDPLDRIPYITQINKVLNLDVTQLLFKRGVEDG